MKDESERIHILVADDHPIYRAGLRTSIEAGAFAKRGLATEVAPMGAFGPNVRLRGHRSSVRAGGRSAVGL